jgi:epoxyqueuosine reductase
MLCGVEASILFYQPMDVLYQQSSMIKAEAHRLGFEGCGISRAAYLPEDAKQLESWLRENYHGSMTYMENHVEKRVDPAKLVEGAQSVISVIINYFPSKNQADPDAPVVSKYAYGKDYHAIIRQKLKLLLHFINKSITPVNGRAFVDSAPVLDKAWAARAGLGWIGKNTCLISPKAGSFFFIGSLIIDLPLSYSEGIPDFCGDCQRCIQACPTRAIIAPRVLDARRCISYMTIEHKGDIDPGFKNKMENRVFGCDICQDVCPWNRKAVPHQVKEFEPITGLLEMTRQEWHALDEKQFKKLFSTSAVKRAKYEGLRRNIGFLQ